MNNKREQLPLATDRYLTVSTAEKRRLLAEAGEPWPVCDCCGIDLKWNARKNRQGGNWHLRCKKRKSDMRYILNNDVEPVSVFQKAKMLAEAGEPWPVCDCCGIRKIWSPNKRLKNGGGWKLRCTTYKTNNESYYTPGRYGWRKCIEGIEARMQKYIEGTEENKQYKEKIYQSWQMKLKEQS